MGLHAYVCACASMQVYKTKTHKKDLERYLMDEGVFTSGGRGVGEKEMV